MKIILSILENALLVALVASIIATVFCWIFFTSKEVVYFGITDGILFILALIISINNGERLTE